MNDTIPIPTTARLTPRSALLRSEISAMHRLLSLHFENVSADQFAADLAEKNWVILIERAGELVGFTTILAYESTFDNKPVSVIYSGDTITSPTAWNTATLPCAWIESVVALRRHYPNGRYVWLLITSGFRTYRFLPVFWRTFYPRHDAQTPADWQRLLAHLAAERFGSQYDAAAGIVRLTHPQRLAGELADIPQGRIDNPHIAFFIERNPGYAAGDELVCITELCSANLTSAGRRMAAATSLW